MIIEPVVWVWGLLACAVIAAFLQKVKVAYGLLAAALLGAFVEERINAVALLISCGVFGLAYILPRLEKPFKFFGWAILVGWSAAMFLHIVPGFGNLLVLDKVLSGPQSTLFSMHLNLDKLLVFFALLLAYPQVLGKRSSWRSPVSFKALILVTVSTLLLLPVAVFLGALKFEPSLPSWWWLFVLNNLLLTCVAEEALFRGALQQSVSDRWGWKAGLVIASLLFGVAHFSGGWLLVIFTTLAGLGYGLVFHITQRLSAAVFVHFLFNFVHLGLFTYPALAG